MAKRQPRLKRDLGNRRYKRLFIIAVEGKKTEPDYFKKLPVQNTMIKVLTASHSAPLTVLSNLKRSLKKVSLNKNDEVWIVIDTDSWIDPHLRQLYEWSKTNPRYGLAVSNPSFEFWLLLHFENGNGISHKRDCVNRLKKYRGDYQKDVNVLAITSEMIDQAIKRAKSRDKPLCTSWPRKCGTTTVYRLVERILYEK